MSSSASSIPGDEVIRHVGGCHCGRVQFEVWAPPVLKVIKCNCTICEKKQNHHFIVPESRFKLVQGENNLTTYTFNKHMAKHMFCKTCGVQSFYRPRSNPDGYGVMPHCIDSKTVEGINYDTFNGLDYETSLKQNPSICDRSKIQQ